MTLSKCKENNIHYRYLDNKKDITILFINSLGTDFRIWDDLVQKVSDHANILLYDKRGHGLSDFFISKNGLEDYAEDARCLLDSLAIKKCVPVGISVGGMIALILAHKYPGQVAKLVLCDTAHKIGTEKTWNDRIEQVTGGGINTISDGVMKRWFAPAFHASQPEKVSGYKNMLERCHLGAYVQTCEAIRDADLTSISKSTKIPALCIVGSEDLSTTPAEVETLSKLIADSKFEVIRESAHLTCVDSSEIFSKLIIDFIK